MLDSNFETLFGSADEYAANSLDRLFDDMDTALEMTLGSYINVADAYVDFMMSLPIYQPIVNFFDKLCMTICMVMDRVQPRIEAAVDALAESKSFKAFGDAVMTIELQRERFILMAVDAFFDSTAWFLLRIDPFVPEAIKNAVLQLAYQFIQMRDGLYAYIHVQIDSEIEENDFKQDIPYIKSRLAPALALLKAHQSELMLNAAFSLIVGQFWASTPASHW